MAKSKVRVHGKEFGLLISSEKIQRAIAKIAHRINRDCKNEKPLFIAVLNGSFLFAADLFKKVNIECEISFIKVASYSGTKSSGNVNKLIGLNENLKGRTLIILEDIVDSGNTLEKVLAEIKKHKPRKLKTAALFFKPEVYKKKIVIQ